MPERYRLGDSSGRASPPALFYNGLGAVVAAENLTDGASVERFTVDGLGNRRMAQRLNAKPGWHPDRDQLRIHSYDAAGRLALTIDSLPVYSTQFDSERTQDFDASGNATLRGERVQDDGSLTTDYLASYYSADEKLSLVSRHRGFSNLSDDSQPGARGVWEQTRYDALGRRVASYAVRGPACPVSESECVSAIERTVWDGDQVLYEIRATPGMSYDDRPSSGPLGAYGRVLYTHGGGIDQPLAVTRLGLEGQPAAVTLSLHAGWQGEFVGATLMSGAPQAPCSGSYGCPQVAWPGGRLTVDGVQPTVPANPAWWGSLTTASGTASGLTYLRNRFYDPTTGQFTQADPIGLAGGPNLYAFAGGDPVNYSDPFGLCPPIKDCLRQAGDLVAGFIPGLSSVHDGHTLATGRNFITGERVGAGGRAIAFVGLVTPFASSQINAAGKVVQHHIFPQALRAKFAGLIDIDQHTMELGDAVHKAIHRGSRGGAWNAAWEEFFEKNLNPTASDLYDHAAKMIKAFGVSGPMKAYKR